MERKISFFFLIFAIFMNNIEMYREMLLEYLYLLWALKGKLLIKHGSLAVKATDALGTPTT